MMVLCQIKGTHHMPFPSQSPFSAPSLVSSAQTINLSKLKNDAVNFAAKKEQKILHASQQAAVQILTKMDFNTLLNADETHKQSAIRKLKRFIERERLKGIAKHWSYDLNKHIALKQALDRLEATSRPSTSRQQD